jgi:hypothetical protein
MFGVGSNEAKAAATKLSIVVNDDVVSDDVVDDESLDTN